MESWTLERIRQHIEDGLPLVPLFNIDVIEASTERGVQFALADVAIYALILAVRRDAAAVTVDLTINFLRPAMDLPLVAEAVALRAGRRLFTAEVRITEEASGKLVSQATGTYALSGS
jgi:uncharacterized protein (TIGR00369 family)